MVKVATKKDSTNTTIVLSSLEKQAAPLFKKLTAVDKIRSQSDFENMGNYQKAIKALGKLASEEKEKMLSPVKETDKRIREHFKPFEEKIKQIETRTKLIMSIYLEENKKKIAQIDDAFEAGKIKKIGTYAAKVADLQVKNSGSVNVRKIKKLKISNEKLIPREYLVPNENLIFEALKEGKTIPGCEIEVVDSIAI